MSEENDFGLSPEDEAQDLPRVVEEAEEILTSYGRVLSGAAFVAATAGLVAGLGGLSVAPVLVTAVFVVLGILYVMPVTREPRLAREVLRRWDQVRIERALESGGVPMDPRMDVAESMAHRIIRHPSVDERTRLATSAMIRRLRRLLHDARRTSYLARAQAVHGRGEDGRSVSDLQDLLDARIANVLARLADLHRTVVLRDTASLERVVLGVEDLVRELEAEVEVERLLASAEQEG